MAFENEEGKLARIVGGEGVTDSRLIDAVPADAVAVGDFRLFP